MFYLLDNKFSVQSNNIILYNANFSGIFSQKGENSLRTSAFQVQTKINNN